MNTTHSIGRFGIGKALVLGAAGLLVTLSGQAAERVMLGTPAASVTVRFDDLNLETTAGARALYARLEWAASQVCGGDQGLRQELSRQYQFQSCYDRALESAVKKVGDARLQALHRARTTDSSVS